MYLDERVREPSGLDWNEKNARTVREQLDRITVAIRSGTFRFAEVFPKSRNHEYFSEKEKAQHPSQTRPEEIQFGEYAQKWFALLGSSGRVSGRTVREYKSYQDHYLIPFFGKMSFAQLNAHVFQEFISWARNPSLPAQFE